MLSFFYPTNLIFSTSQLEYSLFKWVISISSDRVCSEVLNDIDLVFRFWMNAGDFKNLTDNTTRSWDTTD